MSTLAWKKIVFEDEVPNIGNANLTIPDQTTRSLTLGNGGGFRILSNAGTVGLSITSSLLQLGNPTSTTASQIITQDTVVGVFSTNKSVICSDVADFVIESKNPDGLAGPVLNLERDPSQAGGVVNHELGRINFQGDDSNGTGVSYSDITSKIIDPDDSNKNSDLIFRVQDNNIQQSNLVITSSSSSNNALTSNEGLLKALKIQATTLEELTRRCVLTYQVGENGNISNTNGNDPTESFLRGANGVPSQGSTFAGAVGIMVPFDGHIIAGNFSALKDSGVNANLHLEIDRIQPDNTVTSIRIASNNNTGDAKPKSNDYPFASPNTTRSSSLVVSAGDILIPKMIVDSLNGTYVLTDVFAQFYLYTESMIQS